jgi:hypothetical protein
MMDKNSLRIPLDLFPEIQLFSSRYDYWCLLSAAKGLFRDIRYNTRVIRLDENETSQFLNNVTFTVWILSKIKSSSSQLMLHSVTPSSFKLSSVVHELFLMGDGISLPVLQLAEHLELHAARELIDLPPLPVARSLKLRYCTNLSNLPSFSQLKSITLFECRALTDVTPLRELEEVNFSYCNVVNVDSLGRVKRLSLVYCWGITDISKLTDNYSLWVESCQNISSVPTIMNSTSLSINPSLIADRKSAAFPNLKKAKILYSHHIKNLDFLPLKNLLSLHLSSVFTLKTLPIGMKTIPFVSLEKCSVKDISSLGGNKSVSISQCNQIKSLAPLANVPKVHIQSCSSVINGSDLGNIRHLIITNCQKFTAYSFKPGPALQHLELYPCMGNYEALFDIPVLEFSLLMENFPLEGYRNDIIRIHSSRLPGDCLKWFRSRYDIHETEHLTILFKK